jgi:hypothetical protein
MLVPELFQAGRPPEALLAFDASGLVLGCAAFHRRKGAVHGLRLQVPHPCRRRGIGAGLVRCVAGIAAGMPAREVNAAADTMAEPAAEPFLVSCGFTCKTRTTTVEAPMAPLCRNVQALARRAAEHGLLPPGASIASLADVPRAAAARWCREHVVPSISIDPAHAAPDLADPRLSQSPVLLVADEIAGMMLGQANDGRGVSVVAARVVEPRFRGGRGWANLLLMSAALQRGAAAGALHIRFDIPENNRDTLALMRRAHGQVVKIAAWFVRHV